MFVLVFEYLYLSGFASVSESSYVSALLFVLVFDFVWKLGYLSLYVFA